MESRGEKKRGGRTHKVTESLEEKHQKENKDQCCSTVKTRVSCIDSQDWPSGLDTAKKSSRKKTNRDY